ncbi:spore germination protein [Cytobacillus sp. FJAT-54145]|uniref:Spore germination protein n=1 Tax=Cytobacillus spartinae TaxID=3299023 RepID=A0ABW6KHV5_9BACI
MLKDHLITSIVDNFSHMNDFSEKHFLTANDVAVDVFFLKNFVDVKELHKTIKNILSFEEPLLFRNIFHLLPFVSTELFPVEKGKDELAKKLEKGWVTLSFSSEPETLLLLALVKVENRSLSQPENEAIIIGPQVGFNEDLNTNISLIRRILPSKKLYIKEFSVGQEISKIVTIMYIEGLANPLDVEQIEKRLETLNTKVDTILNAAQLSQLLEDNAYSLFPTIRLTERPDDAALTLLKGRIIVLTENSSYALSLPSRMTDFLHSSEDVNLRWPIAIFIRTIRLFAVLLSIILTPLYVGALTYHYEVIPEALLTSIGSSRSRVPFPPLLEALLLEFIIELLREAGARLPTKVGQTIGIVGGIVIGTAAVEAGFTSNILIMLVALGALASFITPSYLMGTIVRFIRFPMILLAGSLGFFGIASGIFFLLLHAVRQYSLGSPYTLPVFPFSSKGIRSLFLYLPIEKIIKGNVFKKAAFTLKSYDSPTKKGKDIDE